MRCRSTAVALAILSMVWSQTASPSAHAASSGSSHMVPIVFADDGDGDAEIYSIRTDGSHRRRLTHDPAADATPSWSPDGSRIAFASERNGTFDIYVMRADGSGQTPLTSGIELDLEPEWSPDGRWIAFARTDPACSGPLTCTRIYTMRSDGSGSRRVTDGAAATWAPDGRRLAVGCYLGAFVGPIEVKDCGERGVFVVRSDGSSRRRIADGFAPAWSPDGRWIAYASGDEGSSVQIRVMKPDGTSRRILTPEAGGILDRHPSWSPDGKRVAFYRKDTPTTFRRVHIISAAGDADTAVTEGSDPSFARR